MQTDISTITTDFTTVFRGINIIMTCLVFRIHLFKSLFTDRHVLTVLSRPALLAFFQVHFFFNFLIKMINGFVKFERWTSQIKIFSVVRVVYQYIYFILYCLYYSIVYRNKICSSPCLQQKHIFTYSYRKYTYMYFD
jgi:hypothetical protein